MPIYAARMHSMRTGSTSSSRVRSYASEWSFVSRVATDIRGSHMGIGIVFSKPHRSWHGKGHD